MKKKQTQDNFVYTNLCDRRSTDRRYRALWESSAAGQKIQSLFLWISLVVVLVRYVHRIYDDVYSAWRIIFDFVCVHSIFLFYSLVTDQTIESTWEWVSAKIGDILLSIEFCAFFPFFSFSCRCCCCFLCVYSSFGLKLFVSISFQWPTQLCQCTLRTLKRVANSVHFGSISPSSLFRPHPLIHYTSNRIDEEANLK